MKMNRLRYIWIWGLLFPVFSFWGCVGPSLYSVNIYYGAEKAAVPVYLKNDVKTSDAIISVAEFTDTRQINDNLVIGHVMEKDGMKKLVFPKNIKMTEAISNGIKVYLRKSGYKVPNKIEQWDLKEKTIPQGVANILVGGNIDELEVYCKRGYFTNTYTANIKLTVVFADMIKGKILFENRVESSYSRESFLFSENILGEEADIVIADAIEKLFGDKTVAQKLKEALAK